MIFFTFYGTVDSVFTAPVRYNLTGLVGFFVSNPNRAYSPMQIITEVPTHTDETTAAYCLSFALFLSIVFFPICLILSMAMIWCLPIKYKYVNAMNIFMQFCMAWSALDVFAVASIAASLQLSRVSQWILNQNYAEICGPGGIIPNAMEKIIGKSAGCFGVDGYLVS